MIILFNSELLIFEPYTHLSFRERDSKEQPPLSLSCSCRSRSFYLPSDKSTQTKLTRFPIRSMVFFDWYEFRSNICVVCGNFDWKVVICNLVQALVGESRSWIRHLRKPSNLQLVNHHSRNRSSTNPSNETSLHRFNHTSGDRAPRNPSTRVHLILQLNLKVLVRVLRSISDHILWWSCHKAHARRSTNDRLRIRQSPLLRPFLWRFLKLTLSPLRW